MVAFYLSNKSTVNSYGPQSLVMCMKSLCKHVGPWLMSWLCHLWEQIYMVRTFLNRLVLYFFVFTQPQPLLASWPGGVHLRCGPQTFCALPPAPPTLSVSSCSSIFSTDYSYFLLNRAFSHIEDCCVTKLCQGPVSEKHQPDLSG